jgi:uncharacterized protein (DUF4415 family)
MKKEYDFSKSKPNPYAAKLKKQITIRLDQDTVDYFKKLAGESDIGYQNLMNLYLRECALQKKKLDWKWVRS